MKHTRILTEGFLARTDLNNSGCGECATSCQSACKTSCTVANQKCENPKVRVRKGKGKR